MTHPIAEKFSFTSILLPLVLLTNLGCLLFLVAQTRNLGDLKNQNERELIIQQQLRNELPVLQARVADLQKERSSLEAEAKAIEQEKTAATKVINEAIVLGSQNEQLRQIGKNLVAANQSQQQTNGAQTEAFSALVKSAATTNAQMKEAEDRLLILNQRLPGLEIKVRDLNQTVSDQGKLLASRDAELDTTNAEIKIAKRTAADRASEIDGLNRQLAGLLKEKADWTEVIRMRAERAELIARIDMLKEDKKTAENALKELERQKSEFGKALAELARQRAELAKAVPANTNTNLKQ